MEVSKFKLFTGEELINQIHTGINYIKSPFVLKEPTKDLEQNAVNIVINHFKDSDVQVHKHEEDGYTVFKAERK